MDLSEYGQEGERRVTIGQLPTPPSDDEIQEGTQNLQIGTHMLFENERLRIWEIFLAPGEELPFHCHRNTYLWIALESGMSFTALPSGETWTWEHTRGEVQFAEVPPDEALVHNLKNVGPSPLRFATVELLS